MARKRLREMGSRAEGVVCDEHDWGGHNPTIIRPKRRASGTVYGIYPAAPNVVKIRTDTGEKVVIRTEL